ncbi:alkaline-phosphatase-like protein [Choanephora cucurbitarum]|nr:alkaline-phosphatase-like protein [Choanephora cucurbitarum]
MKNLWSISITLATLLLQSTVIAKQPNIVFVFTDDQDYRLNSLDYMPNVQKYLVDQGTLYRNHYATISVCCPSRVGLLRGQYAHNTNITSVSPPHGGYDKFNTLKLGEDYLPLWLQKSGYSTNYIGKLMNHYTINNYNSPKPKGFDYQDQLVDPYTYVYHTAVFSTNGQAPHYYKDAYQTDVIHAKTRAALKRLQAQEDPFFLWVAPVAPHGEFFLGNDGSVKTRPAVPASRHAHLFKDVKIPRHPHFNPDTQTKTASFWKDFEKLNETLVEEFDETYRNRLRALQAVDELVATVFEELEASGELDNTYVFYSADNGYHLGQHRAYPGKMSNLEEDINVPFIVRGPGVPKGQISDLVSSHHDLASTFVALASGDQHLPSWVDGGVIPLNEELSMHKRPISKESFAVEYWGSEFLPEGYDFMVYGHNTYKTLRVISQEYNYMYTVWCTGEHEFYDLKKDPYELENLFESVDTQLLNRLDALLVVLKSCRAESCRDPWKILHTDGSSVSTLKDALDPKYDAHYAQFRHVQFEECLEYQLASNEQPRIGNHFLSNATTEIRQYSGLQRTFGLFTKQHKKREELEHSAIVASKEHLELFKLIANYSASGNVGDYVLNDEQLVTDALSLPSELLSSNVDWSQYNFYNFGN